MRKVNYYLIYTLYNTLSILFSLALFTAPKMKMQAIKHHTVKLHQILETDSFSCSFSVRFCWSCSFQLIQVLVHFPEKQEIS